jgi:hypothetical protein
VCKKGGVIGVYGERKHNLRLMYFIKDACVRTGDPPESMEVVRLKVG